MAARVKPNPLNQDEYSVMMYDSESGTMTLQWSESTGNMTDENFKEIVAAYAGFAEQYRIPRLLVDVTKFRHRTGPEIGTWRSREIVPRYHNAGVKRFAYVVGEDKVPQGQSPEKAPGEQFETGYFGTEDQAMRWLLAS
jgi:hypothetical protein